MSSTETESSTVELLPRPKRADARRNYDRVVAAAREAFAERGASTSLEEIARRAGVGIGTLYRNFPNRQALAAELMDYIDRDAPLFKSCRSQLFAAGEPLLARAQGAGVVRADTNIRELVQLIGGIAKIQTADPQQIEHMLDIALDGLRFPGAD